jgi:hypothetical protein
MLKFSLSLSLSLSLSFSLSPLSLSLSLSIPVSLPPFPLPSFSLSLSFPPPCHVRRSTASGALTALVPLCLAVFLPISLSPPPSYRHHPPILPLGLLLDERKRGKTAVLSAFPFVEKRTKERERPRKAVFSRRDRAGSPTERAKPMDRRASAVRNGRQKQAGKPQKESGREKRI